ncbi:MAG TPA: PilZ domain-containing protein [Pyrinomonadaceae bacterium]|nr:PilZ domain-containing protein [Pyrinomonadaceae bacterium]
MASQDRRSGIERRATNRYQVDVEVQWQASDKRAPGSISDVSLDGCFVLCSGDVQDGDQVKVFIPLADGMKVEFLGHVTNYVVEIGFGIKFEPLSAAPRDLLMKIVRSAGNR